MTLSGSDAGKTFPANTQEHGNIHHNVPQSLGGSNEDCNLSDVAVPRHNAFHKLWGTNRLPTDLVRILTIHSLGMENPDLRVPPDQLAYVCRGTRTQDLGNLYRSHALRSVADPMGLLLSWQTTENRLTHLLEEITWTRQTIDALRLKDDAFFPARHHTFAQQAMKFFDVESPAKAAEGLLAERNMGTLSWTRPVLANVRESMLNVLKGTHMQRGRKNREHLSVLQLHLEAVTRQQRELAAMKDRLVEAMHNAFNGMHEESDGGR